MSKLSFRARALDATKPMPVYQKDELSDLQDYSVLNRAVPQMPSGMEKEEESEHHLQRAISAQQVYGDAKVMVIPVPEADMSMACYNNLYKKTFRMPKHYVLNQAQALNSILEQEKPDYDMDSEDESWINDSDKRSGLDISHNQFEEMIDRLEKSCGNQIVTLQEAKLLLKEDDDLIKSVYDYWTKKRNRHKTSLIYQVRQERRDGTSINDCYVAFRRRTEKMQTRKNRKNDESLYEKMLKLRRELSRAVTILEMMKKREKSKRELLHLTLEVFEKRFQMRDWDGRILRGMKKEMFTQRARTHLRIPGSSQFRRKRHISVSSSKGKMTSSSTQLSISRGEIDRDVLSKKLKKKKSRPNLGVSSSSNLPVQAGKPLLEHLQNKTSAQLPFAPKLSSKPTRKESLSYQDVVDTMTQYEFPPSSDEDTRSTVIGSSSPDNFDPKKFPDGTFTFRRKPGCVYYAPVDELVGDWPWMSDPRHRYNLTSLSTDRCVGFARRRVGRGGRVMLDRAYHPYNRHLENIDVSGRDYLPPTSQLQDLLKEIKQDRWSHYRPTTESVQGAATKESDENCSSAQNQPGHDLAWSLDFSGRKQAAPAGKNKKRPTPVKQKKCSSLELDKSSVAFAMSALVPVSTTTPVTMTTVTHSSKSSRLPSSVNTCRIATNSSKTYEQSPLKCATCGGLVTLTSTLTDSRTYPTTLGTSGQQRVMTSTSPAINQRTTVLPATVTVSMSRAGLTHTTGVPALLRISSGSVGLNTVLYPHTQPSRTTDNQPIRSSQSDLAAGTNAAIHARRALPGQRAQRGAVNVNLALPANVLATLSNDASAGTRGTQSAPSSPKSSQNQTNEGNNGPLVKGSRVANARTINLNLGSLASPQAAPLIGASYASSSQVVNTGRITIAGNMLKLGSGALFSVSLPQSTKPVATAASTSSSDGMLVAEDGSIVLSKLDDLKRKNKKAAEASNSAPDVKSISSLSVKKAQGDRNHTVQINIGSSPGAEVASQPKAHEPLTTHPPNTAPVKSSKSSRAMEVT
ncbi:uncharacterized protein LOC143470058 [Clavelina lepadiformis]|uniref:uncharacterized protein LOC143470058 n=1 Tax=Clavelina lepadiformis TaxID=159417 RepID=UPI0040420126